MTKTEKREAAVKQYITDGGLLDWKNFRKTYAEHSDIPELAFRTMYRKIYELAAEECFGVTHEQAHEQLKLITKNELSGFDPRTASITFGNEVVCKAFGAGKKEVLISFKGNNFVQSITLFKTFIEKKTGLVRARLFRIKWNNTWTMPSIVQVDNEGAHIRHSWASAQTQFSSRKYLIE